MIRLDKYLADMGIGTRTAVKQMIRKGQVQVNQETAARPELKIDEQNDKVQVNGQTIGSRKRPEDTGIHHRSLLGFRMYLVVTV